MQQLSLSHFLDARVKDKLGKMLQVAGLYFDYEDNALLRNIHFTVRPGELFYLRGKNGVGKTTLLKLLAGLLYPHQGDISFDQQSIQFDRSRYQQHLCYVGHKPGLSATLTIRENYRFAIYDCHETQLDACLAVFDLLKLADKPYGQLSLGQRKRASLLQLMISPAKIWLLDEPLNSLDKESIALFFSRVEAHLRQQGIIIMTSHQDLPAAQSYPIQEYFL